ncbi:MAG: hypothetical protein ACOC2R_02865 [Spirochaetota bacterium]
MRYTELHSQSEIDKIIEDIKTRHGNLSKIFVSDNLEETIRGNLVITVLRNFEPVMKIEAEDKQLINQLRSVLDSSKKAY